MAVADYDADIDVARIRYNSHTVTEKCGARVAAVMQNPPPDQRRRVYGRLKAVLFSSDNARAYRVRLDQRRYSQPVLWTFRLASRRSSQGADAQLFRPDA